uniref:Uncharacterized protein n=1 Tax=Arundo donax TaxID=35708 RepID=A0A0A8ZXJ3_ARUDO
MIPRLKKQSDYSTEPTKWIEINMSHYTTAH